METIRFQTNIPVEVALKFDPPGKQVEGRYGAQVFFTTTDDRGLYVSPVVADKIGTLGIVKGEVFSICKRETKNGQKRAIEWEVNRPGEAAASGPAPVAAPSQPPIELPQPTTAQPLNGTVSMGLGLPAAKSNGHANGHAANGVKLDTRKPAEIIDPKLVAINGGAPKLDEDTALIMARGTSACSALKTAIAAMAEAEKFAKEINYGVRFEAQHIYGLACTILIGKQREANGNGGYR